MTKEKLFQIITEGTGLNEVFAYLCEQGAKDELFNQLQNESMSAPSPDLGGRLKTYISKFLKNRNQASALQLFICSLNSQEFSKLQEPIFAENAARYKDSYLDWQPFAENESIAELLEEYKTKGYPIVYEPFRYEDVDFCHEIQKKQESTTFIIDCHALFVYESECYMLDNASDIGSLIFPMCPSYSAEVKQKLAEKQNKVFKKTCHAYNEKWKDAYPYIELAISTKYDFFRRLTNIAVTRFGFGELKMKLIKPTVFLNNETLKGIQNAKDTRL